jgi:transposase
MRQLGMPVSDDTLLRHVKSAPRVARPGEALRVVGVDDWAWRKGQRYGTILVYLERRVVADVLADRSSAAVGAWLSKHPSVRIVTRDRHGLYAEVLGKAHLKLVRSLIAFTWSRIYARQWRSN